METIRSRHNDLIRRFRMLGADGDFRREQGEFIGAGQKLLDEAEKIRKEDEAACYAMGEYGLSLLSPGMGILIRER